MPSLCSYRTVLCTWSSVREILVLLQKSNCAVKDVLTVGIISQCIRISSHAVHFKYVTVLLVSYTSVKLEVGAK